jgi:hypothetical protein
MADEDVPEYQSSSDSESVREVVKPKRRKKNR